jgi:plastocyanin
LKVRNADGRAGNPRVLETAPTSGASVRFFIGTVAVAALAWALPAAAQRDATVVKVTAGKPTEFKFAVSKRTVPHGAVTFDITNAGTLPHNFKIAGKTTKLLAGSQSQTLTVTFAKPGKYAYLCTVTGHADAGMKGILTVT